MKTLKELIKELQRLRREQDDVEKQLEEYSDGYKYEITYSCYRKEYTVTFKNEYEFLECFADSGDGDNYIIKSNYTNNPEYDKDWDWMEKLEALYK